MEGDEKAMPRRSPPGMILGIVVQSPIGNTDYLITPRRGA